MGDVEHRGGSSPGAAGRRGSLPAAVVAARQCCEASGARSAVGIPVIALKGDFGDAFI